MSMPLFLFVGTVGYRISMPLLLQSDTEQVVAALVCLFLQSNTEQVFAVLVCLFIQSDTD